MANRRSAPFWFVRKATLLRILTRSGSVQEALLTFGVERVAGGYYTSLRHRACQDGLETEFEALLQRGRRSGIVQTTAERRTPLDRILVAQSTYGNRSCLKQRLIVAGLLVNRCAICGIRPEWNGSSLVLILDHINGVRNDNRLFNLRLLCPNCNSQTETFAGRNKKKLGSSLVAKAAGSDPAIAGSSPAFPADRHPTTTDHTRIVGSTPTFPTGPSGLKMGK